MALISKLKKVLGKAEKDRKEEAAMPESGAPDENPVPHVKPECPIYEYIKKHTSLQDILESNFISFDDIVSDYILYFSI